MPKADTTFTVRQAQSPLQPRREVPSSSQTGCGAGAGGRRAEASSWEAQSWAPAPRQVLGGTNVLHSLPGNTGQEKRLEYGQDHLPQKSKALVSSPCPGRHFSLGKRGTQSSYFQLLLQQRDIEGNLYQEKCGNQGIILDKHNQRKGVALLA